MKEPEILPSDSLQQQELYEVFMRLSNSKRLSTIKGAALNLLLAAILKVSSNPDEAILQWNELSSKAEEIIRERWTAYSPPDFDPTRIIFNGG